MFFINDGEIVIRKVPPEQDNMIKKNMAEFDDWARKRKCEIDMMEDPDERKAVFEELQEKIDQIKIMRPLLKL
ncbi:MAG: hypothetical protein E7Z64_06805 [Thermoplasmata archaeon]|nr:hypothetical protein [Thermoplasmata archaeon]